MKKTGIVLAEDHVMLRQGLSALLAQHQDLEVIGEASDGIEAVELIMDLCPDIAVVDISLPRMDGIDVIKAVKSRGTATRIITLSMHSQSHYVKAALRAGTAGYVLKDSAAGELRKAIEAVSNGELYLSQSVSAAMAEDFLATGGASDLTARELQVLTEIADGASTKAIAEKLHLSPKTIETHRKKIMDKLDIRSVADLTRYAIRQGLIEL